MDNRNNIFNNRNISHSVNVSLYIHTWEIPKTFLSTFWISDHIKSINMLYLWMKELHASHELWQGPPLKVLMNDLKCFWHLSYFWITTIIYISMFNSNHFRKNPVWYFLEYKLYNDYKPLLQYISEFNIILNILLRDKDHWKLY